MLSMRNDTTSPATVKNNSINELYTGRFAL